MPHHHVVKLKVVILVIKVRVFLISLFLIYIKHIIKIPRKKCIYPKKPTSHHINYSHKTMTSQWPLQLNYIMIFGTEQLQL
jgi:hypothetical protein